MLPDTADVVIIGGGVMGTSTAYHLARRSGHGFMHGPAAGLLVSEMILDGRAHSLDIHQLRYSRFAEGDLVREHNVV